jgi:hypothetical protein
LIRIFLAGFVPTTGATLKVVGNRLNPLAFQRCKESNMAKAKKQTTRGRKQDRARVAGGQKYEVGYEAKKTGRSASAVKKAVKKVGSSRKKVERKLGR